MVRVWEERCNLIEFMFFVVVFESRERHLIAGTGMEGQLAHCYLWVILLAGGGTVGEWDSRLREAVVEGRIQEDVLHGVLSS